MIPHAALLHYRCIFDLTPSSEMANGWTEIIKTIRSWIKQRTPSDQGLGGQWFYTGGEWKPAHSPRVSIKTERVIGNGTDTQPQSWAIRFEHPCDNVAFRQWRTDIGITVLRTNEYQFSLATTHWILPEYIGEEPAVPVPSAPNIVSMLIKSPRWKAFAGTEPLSCDPIPLIEGQGKEFQDRLENPNRLCPIILIAREFDTGLPKVNPSNLSRLLAGTAVVFVSDTTGVDKELEWLIPRNYRCWNGMVRVYQPIVRFESNFDFKRHRYFTREQIEALTPEGIVESIVRGVARRSRMLSAAGVTSLEDVWSKQHEIDSQKLREKLAGQPELQEYIANFDRENAALKRQLKNSASQIESLQLEVEAFDETKNELEIKVSALNSEIGYVRQEADSIRSINRQLKDQNEAIQSFENLPSSVLEVIELIGRLHPDKIFFTERALTSAEDASLEDVEVAWRCIWSMATILHGLHFDEDKPANLEKEFREKTGFDLSLTETGTTKNDKKLMGLRKCTYNGEVVDITPHVRYGGREAKKSLRVHYYPHHGEKRLIVCHCGDHLDTSGTRRRK
jgi:hypothetical protein